eukprot:scaffold129989_cov63-Phaeocystis_antarctica.AAC.8
MQSTCSTPVRGLCLVTIGSAAWLGPHLPSRPRPRSPVRPSGLSGAPYSSNSMWPPKVTSSAPAVYVLRASSSSRSACTPGGSAHLNEVGE